MGEPMEFSRDGVLGTALLLGYSLHTWRKGVVPLSLGAVSEPGDTPWGRIPQLHGGHMMVAWWSHDGHMVVT